MSESALIPVEEINAVEVFSGEKLTELLEKIEAHTTTFAADVETEPGRKEIASMAYKIARSKTTIDEAGKDLVSEWKKKSKAVDAERKRARDFLDDLKETVRKPLTEWEAEQERIKQEAIEAEKKRLAEIEEQKRRDIEERERKLKEREEALAKAEAEARAKEEAEKAEKERLAREEKIRAEGAERAKREAQEAVEKAEREKVAAEQREKEAAERADQEKREAIEAEKKRAAEEARKKEEQEKALAQKQRLAEEKRAADRKHRQKINASAMKAFIEEGLTEKMAKDVITMIASGSIPSITINY